MADISGLSLQELAALGTDLLRMVASIPLGRLIGFSGGRISRTRLDELLVRVNSAQASDHPLYK